MSAAEPLPDDGSRVPGSEPSRTAFVDADIIRDERPWNTPEDLLDDHEPEASGPAVDWCPDLPDVDSAHMLTLAEHGVVGLPRRYLPHSCPKSLYWMFVSEERARDDMADAYDDLSGSGYRVHAPVPSYTTFWRRWSQVSGMKRQCKIMCGLSQRLLAQFASFQFLVYLDCMRGLSGCFPAVAPAARS